LKNFTPEERKIRNEWASRHRKVITDKSEYDKAMAGFAEMFKSLSKKGG
jgi:hypothetical protein